MTIQQIVKEVCDLRSEYKDVAKGFNLSRRSVAGTRSTIHFLDVNLYDEAGALAHVHTLTFDDAVTSEDFIGFACAWVFELMDRVFDLQTRSVAMHFGCKANEVIRAIIYHLVALLDNPDFLEKVELRNSHATSFGRTTYEINVLGRYKEGYEHYFFFNRKDNAASSTQAPDFENRYRVYEDRSYFFQRILYTTPSYSEEDAQRDYEWAQAVLQAYAQAKNLIFETRGFVTEQIQQALDKMEHQETERKAQLLRAPLQVIKQGYYMLVKGYQDTLLGVLSGTVDNQELPIRLIKKDGTPSKVVKSYNVEDVLKSWQKTQVDALRKVNGLISKEQVINFLDNNVVPVYDWKSNPYHPKNTSAGK